MLLALCATYWGLRFFPAPAGSPAPTASYVPPAPVDPAALARVFGPAQEPAAAASSPVAVSAPADTLVLQGVVANRAARGVALIAVNGKPARPYRVGSRIEDSYVLQSVAARSAVVARSDNGPAMTLELAPPAPNTATPAPSPTNGPAQVTAPPTAQPTTPNGRPSFLRPPPPANPPALQPAG